MPESILGISAFYHDSAAALLTDGEVIAAVQEERFSRIKHDPSFPIQAIKYVLEEGNIDLKELTAIVFYDKPFLKFERLLECYHAMVPKGLQNFLYAMPVWIKEKLFIQKLIKDKLNELGKINGPLLFPEHHLSHAASAFYPSPFQEAAILTIDGVGEWATTTIGYGNKHHIDIIQELHFPHSLGLLYAAFTYYTGFEVNGGEYKLMGLASYGNPESDRTLHYKEKILTHLIDIKEDGSFALNMSYFQFATGNKMTNNRKWNQLFGIPPRQPDMELTQSYMDLAYAIQQVTEEVIVKLAETAQLLTGSNYLVMAGGVALNCVANGTLLKQHIFDRIWIQPAAGDAGGALGAAYAAWHIWQKNSRQANASKDSMKGAFLGPSFDDKTIHRTLEKQCSSYIYYEKYEDLAVYIANLLAKGKIIGWFQGRMEYGPRALGNRSILADSRDPDMKSRINKEIKFRESFRPFAPVVLEEDIQEYFAIRTTSPYMLFAMPVRKSRQLSSPVEEDHLSIKERFDFPRSDIPSVTHVDYTARIQSVNRDINPKLWLLINEFKKQTQCSVLLNTSFNVKGEPIVCTPEEAYQCFEQSKMDVLVMGNYIVEKQNVTNPM